MDKRRHKTEITKLKSGEIKLSSTAIARRRIIIEQCQLIDPEYTVRMPHIHVKVEN